MRTYGLSVDAVNDKAQLEHRMNKSSAISPKALFLGLLHKISKDGCGSKIYVNVKKVNALFIEKLHLAIKLVRRHPTF